MEKKNRAIVGILLMIFIFFVILMIFATYTLKMFQGDGQVSFSANSKAGNSVAVVEVNGVIMEAKPVIELLHRAYEDKETKAIVLRVNSPGGAVGPTQEIYEEIRRIDDLYTSTEGKEGKPVYGSFGSIAASGGYYVGAATRKLYANAGTITGSIGVIMQFLDLSQLFDLAKVKQENIKSGRYKDFGQPNRSMTEEEKALLEKTISGVHKQFVNDVLKMRKEKIKTDIWELAQGQIFSGEEAKSLGLVDELAGLYEAGRRIHEELKLEGKFGLKFIKPKKKTNFFELVDNLEGIADKVNMFGKQNSNPFMLLYNPR